MGRKTQTEKPQKITAAVQTARGGGHPFGVIDRHRPLTRPEFAVYDAIREAVPIVDAAIGKIIRLIGGFYSQMRRQGSRKRAVRVSQNRSDRHMHLRNTELLGQHA